MRFTELEIKLIKAYIVDDYVNDSGWESGHSATWQKDFWKDAEIPSKSYPGVMSSLVKKGVMWSNGESFGLTEMGVQAIKNIV